jgi:membrane-associated phospholipid phosphatase
MAADPTTIPSPLLRAGADPPPSAGARAHDQRPWYKVPPLHKRQVGLLAIAYIVLTGIYTAVGFAIVEWWEPSALGERDADLNRWLEDHRTESRNTLAEWGSALSNTETKIALLLMLLPLMLWMYRRWHDWAFLVIALLFEVSVFGTSSKIVVRERPPVEQLDGAPTHSWPSGHIAAATVFYVGLALIVYWNTRSKLSRTVFTVIAVAAPVIVTASRLYQGMHYLSDIVGGIVLGAVTLVLVRALMLHAGEDPRYTASSPAGPQ